MNHLKMLFFKNNKEQHKSLNTLIPVTVVFFAEQAGFYIH